MKTVAVITGASQGIGEAIAVAIATLPDARLFLVARNRVLLEQVARRCQAMGAHAEVFVCDLTKEEAVATMVGQLESRGERVNLLINNAGRFVQQSLFSTSVEAFRECISVNLISAFMLTRLLAPPMMQRGSGTIIFMGSVASTRAYEQAGAYCAAKHGLLGLARSTRKETKGSGVRVTTIMPGATQSPSWKNSEVPTHRLMPAEDIASSVLSIYRMSERSVVEEIVLRPIAGDL